MKRKVKTRPIYECRCDESMILGYTGLIGELEHLKIETRLIDEMFASVERLCERLCVYLQLD
jgi:hypothetical protein